MTDFDTESTICAIATGQAPSPRGAIRISGNDSFELVRSILGLNNIIPKQSSRPFRQLLQWPLDDGSVKLPVSLWCWPTTQSYTGLPSIEVHTVGNPVLLEMIIEQLCKVGARLARPGEFTLRAFLAGRLDLTQCEAVLGVIEAKSNRAFNAALQQLSGGLAIPLRSLRSSLLELLADIEAGLDFVDEDIEFISPSEILSRLQSSALQLSKLVEQLYLRSTSKSSYSVALIGRPNAGKSSLFNSIIGEENAIVHHDAGTTRDFLRRTTSLKHGTVEWIDTAGQETDKQILGRSSSLDINKAAQRMAQEQSRTADLVLYCREINDPEPILWPSVDGEVWLVQTKVDDPLLHSNDHLDSDVTTPFTCRLHTSSLTGRGVNDLKERVDDWLSVKDEESAAVVPLTATRCLTRLIEARQSITLAAEETEHGSGDEIVAGELRLALDALGQVAGVVYTDDILDSLFSRFCIGK